MSRIRRPRTERLARRALLLAAALLPIAAAHAGAATDARTPAAFIQRVGDQTVAILRAPGVPTPERLKALVDVLDDATDLALVGRLVLGPYWRQASEQQRADYLQVFRELVVSTMAERLDSYGGETFDIVGERTVDERDTLVATRIHRPNAGSGPVAVDWRVRRTDDRFAIIDIIAEGVSMVVTQRSEVGSVVGQKGIDGLIADMRERLHGQS